MSYQHDISYRTHVLHLIGMICDTYNGGIEIQTSNYEMTFYNEELDGGTEIQRILVYVDGSQRSEHALKFALDLAKKYSAEICLLHVIPIVPICSSIPNSWEPFPPLYMIESEAEGEEILASALSKVSEAGVKSVAKVDYGRPARRIIQEAKEKLIDLIVMGAENRGFFSRLFLGSISDHVSRHAPCPVLLVKRSQEKNELTNREVP